MAAGVFRRLVVGLGCAIAVVALSANSASAFSLSPTNWTSSINSIVPATDAVSVEVINGGDALRLTAQPGHVVVVPGYRNEPYFRIAENGEVDANLRSPTWWANRTSSGTGDIPESADPSAEPEWTNVANNGSVIWHDHRIHAMPGVTDDTDWTVLVSVDDYPLVVRGRLTQLPSHSPIAELLVAIVVAGGVLALGLRSALRAALRTTMGATLGASTLALLIAIGGWTATPSGFRAPTTLLLAAGLALLFAVACVLTRNASRRLQVVTTLASVAALGWWTALMLPAVTAAFVPNSFGDTVVRSVIAIAAGVVVGVAIVVVMTGGFSDADHSTHAEMADLEEVVG